MNIGRISNIIIAVAAVATLTACASAPQYKNSGKILPTTLPFSEAVQVGNTLWMSGQIGNIPGSLNLAPGGISGESKQVLENIKTSLEAHGYSMADVVKCTAMLADMKEWNAFNEVYQTYFQKGKFPARSAFGSSGLAFNARVELECFASK
ncbi:RidA family protein [Ottowia thiooxydans]|uniref:2-iminobutanoate/2-iminopropanoate deaminase n=1 Tax=Ottowia thiooxydans TaxID=219182 RepID=A0ABV2QG00_9BURK